MKRLLINADDFGLSSAISEAILEATDRGVVTSTSVMLCTEAGVADLAAHACGLAGRAGVHLQLSGGTPRAPREHVPSLVTAEGTFPTHRRSLVQPRPEEIECEWRAQMETFLAAGLRPTHIDSHQHAHKHPAAFSAYCRIAAEYRVPARACDPAMLHALRTAGVGCPDVFECGWTGNCCTVDDLLARIDAAFRACGGAGTVEVMCHPGRTDLRGKELEALCDPTLPGKLRERGIALDKVRASTV